MHPIMGRLGSFLFYSYTTLLGLGLGAGLALTAWRARRRPATPAYWLDGVIAALLLGLAAGRAGYVAAHWDYFQAHLGESWRLWRGGLAYHPAILGGLLGAGAWCGYRRCRPAAYADLLAPAAALWSAFGWTACRLEGCAYGRQTFLGPLAADLPDNFGVYAVRYQTQLAGLAVSLLALLLFWWLRQRLPPGGGFWLVGAILSSGRAWISLYRGDLQPLYGPLSAAGIADLVLALLALTGLAISYRYRSVHDADASQAENSIE